MVRRCRGFTILEMVIIFSLLLLLLSLTALYFVKGQRYLADVEAYSTLQRESSLTLRHITTRLARSTPRHMVAKTQEDATEDPSYVYFLSFEPYDPIEPYILFDGPVHQVVWRKWVCLFHAPEEEQIKVAYIPLISSTHDLSSKPAPDVDYASFLSAKPQSLGRHFTQVAFRQSEQKVSVMLTARAHSPVPQRLEKDKVIELQIHSRVSLVN